MMLLGERMLDGGRMDENKSPQEMQRPRSLARTHHIFMHSFIRSFIPSFIHSFIHWITPPLFIDAYMHSFSNSFIHSIALKFPHALIIKDEFIHLSYMSSLTYSFIVNDAFGVTRTHNRGCWLHAPLLGPLRWLVCDNHGCRLNG